MTDQVALNYAIYRCGLFDRTELLPAWCNWTCHFGFPAWDSAALQYVEPNLPHTPIGIVHLTGPKFDRAIIATTDDAKMECDLRYTGATPVPATDEALPAKSFLPMCAVDYVSPGLEIVVPDGRAFVSPCYRGWQPHLA